MSNRSRGRTSAPTAALSAEGDGTVGPAFPARGTDDAPSRPNEPATTVRASEPPEHLFRHLLSRYLAGAGSIVVIQEPRLSPRTLEVVEEFCRRTRELEPGRRVGHRVELVETRPSQVLDLDAPLQHLGEAVLQFHREAHASWGAIAFDDEGYWARRDDEIDREAWYLERCLSRLGSTGSGVLSNLPRAWTIIRSLERIADHAVTLGEVGVRLADRRLPEGMLRELRQFHVQALEHLEAVLRSPDGSGANDLLDVGEALIAGGRALSERLLPAVGDGTMAPATAAAVARAFEAILRTVAYSQDMAQVLLEGPVRSAPRWALEVLPALPPEGVTP